MLAASQEIVLVVGFIVGHVDLVAPRKHTHASCLFTGVGKRHPDTDKFSVIQSPIGRMVGREGSVGRVI